MAFDRFAGRGPGAVARGGLECPPIRINPERVKTLQHAADRVVVNSSVPARDHLEHELVSGLPAGVEEPHDFCLLRRAQVRRIVRMVKDRALDRVHGRPLQECRSRIGILLEGERPRTWHLDRAPDPKVPVRGIAERLFPKPIVEKYSEPVAAAGGFARRLQGQRLETSDSLEIGAEALCQNFELTAVVDRESQEAVLRSALGRGPVNLIEPGVRPQSAPGTPVVQEIRQLGPGRDRRRAAVAGYGEGAAGVGKLAAGLVGLIPYPAAQESAYEGVASADDVVDLDRETGTGYAVIQSIRDRIREYDASHRAALTHYDCAAPRADGPDRGQSVGAAAGHMDLLLGPDDKVAERQDRLQMLGHPIASHIALFAEAMAGQAPKDRTVVDVEHDPAMRRSSGFRRLARGRLDGGGREMGPGQHHGLGGGDVVRVDVAFGEGHVGAFLTVENERKGIRVANAENDQRRQPFRVRDQSRRIHALALKSLANEPAHVLVADAADEACPQAQP